MGWLTVVRALLQRMAARRAAAAVGGAALLLLTSGCTSGSPEIPGPSSASASSMGPALTPDAVKEVLYNDLQAETYFDMDRDTWQRMTQIATSLPWRVAEAGGVRQAAACSGAGSPTVVYIDGWGTPAAGTWSLAAAEQATSNRVCLFDRPGLGLSPARRGAAPHSTPEQHAQEMLDLLAALGEPGPYLLVPWSYGGLVARAAATQHPEQVAGMVLVDASSPLQSGLDEPLQGENGIVDADTIAATVGSGPDMGDRPVIVLQAGQRDGVSQAQRTEWSTLQQQAATLSTNSVHAVVDGSDHYIPQRNPAAIIAATSAASDSIRRSNAPLDPCPQALAATGATCPSA